MSGNYVGSFGDRMKDIPKRTRTRRTKGWYRMRRYYPLHGGIANSKRGPWRYFDWTKPISELDEFARRILGSYRELEFVGNDRPLMAAKVAYAISAGVELFLETL